MSETPISSARASDALLLGLVDRAVAVARQAPGAERQLGDAEAGLAEGAGRTLSHGLAHPAAVAAHAKGSFTRRAPESSVHGQARAGQGPGPREDDRDASETESRRAHLREPLSLGLAACAGEEPRPRSRPPPPPPPPARRAPRRPGRHARRRRPPSPRLAELIPPASMKAMRRGASTPTTGEGDGQRTSPKTAPASPTATASRPTDGTSSSKAMRQPLRVVRRRQVGAGRASGSRATSSSSRSAWAGTMTGDFMGMKATKKPVGPDPRHVMTGSTTTGS